MGRLIVIGERLVYRLLDGRAEPPPPPPEAIFDRGLALTGAGALGILAGLTVAVVGASGTGSLTCELLARAGCRHILLIDDDVTKIINLNRILYATQEDVDKGTPKVEVIRRGIEGLGLDCRVELVRGNVLDRDVLARLREADILVGCVDKAFPVSPAVYRHRIGDRRGRKRHRFARRANELHRAWPLLFAMRRGRHR
jgi:NADPH:quinone reductase-like Zn-dependent oxidoreductase